MSHGFCGPHFLTRDFEAACISVGMTAFDKAALRAESLAKRAAVSAPAAAAFAQRLADLGPELAKGQCARVVSAYAAIGEEIDTFPLLHALDAAGFEVALPITGKRGAALVFRKWTPATIMVPGRMAIPEPPPEAKMLEPDLLFVPLAAFDRRGHRIGYGAGFYDRTLEELRAKKTITAIGLAYSTQETLFIPSEDHDQPLDFVVTEKDTILCADGG